MNNDLNHDPFTNENNSYFPYEEYSFYAFGGILGFLTFIIFLTTRRFLK